MSEKQNNVENAMSEQQVANVIKGLDAVMAGSKSLLERKDAIFALLKLFETGDKKLLHMITEISKEQLETMNRHDTLIESLIDIGHLKKVDADSDTDYCGELRHIKDTMHDSFALHAVSKTRKARNEVITAISQIPDVGRTIAEKLAGKSK